MGARIEQNAANALAHLGASGLARGQYFQAPLTQKVGEPLLVRALAAAIEALEGDELSAFCFVPHRGMITKREGAG